MSAIADEFKSPSFANGNSVGKPKQRSVHRRLCPSPAKLGRDCELDAATGALRDQGMAWQKCAARVRLPRTAKSRVRAQPRRKS